MRNAMSLKPFILLLAILPFHLSAQQADFNISLIANLDYPEFCNDIWGFVDQSGDEYAILGTADATVVISLQDPAKPEEIARIPGSSSLSRDIKSWGNYVYAVTGAGKDGLLVIDMSAAPDSISYHFYRPEVPIDNNGKLESCHNLYIDENGFAYLAGCNANQGGVLIFDVKSDPRFPVYAGAADPFYAHDVFVRGDTLWSSEPYNGLIAVMDVSDKSAPVTIATQQTGAYYAHNSWLSDDGRYLFTTDEVPGAYVTGYDVSDLSNIRRLDGYRPRATENIGVIPHNVHYHQGFLVTSFYTDGVKIIDAHQPDNLIEVGSYDTYLGNNARTFDGCWGAFPYLPSGLLIVSDIERGLFILQPEYQAAAYLEGTVRDKETGKLLFDVQIALEGTDSTRTATNLQGIYKTGQAVAGNLAVSFTHPAYETLETTATLVNGKLTVLDVELEARLHYQLNGSVVKDEDGQVVNDAAILVRNQDFSYPARTDENGRFHIEDIIAGNYTLYVGKWGYLNEAIDLNVDVPNLERSVILRRGYQDNFMLDLGWTVEGDAATGRWERGEPVGTTWGLTGPYTSPEFDIGTDDGEFCFITGNGGGGAEEDDVDRGKTVLRSPWMDLTDYQNPQISYYTWFYNYIGDLPTVDTPDPNDDLQIFISNGSTTVLLESIHTSLSQWRPKSTFSIKDHLRTFDQIQLTVVTADLPNSPHIVEAAFDAFLIEEGEPPTNTLFPEKPEFILQAAPNPFQQSFKLHYEVPVSSSSVRITIHDLLGRTLVTTELEERIGHLNMGADLDPGLYLIRLQMGDQVGKTIKVIKSL